MEMFIGVLKVVLEYQKTHQHVGEGYTVQESWLAKLGQWDEALKRYNQRLDVNPQEIVAILGKLKCLDALGQWSEAIDLFLENLELLKYPGTTGSSSSHTLEKAAVISARAAWSLNQVPHSSNENPSTELMRMPLQLPSGAPLK